MHKLGRILKRIRISILRVEREWRLWILNRQIAAHNHVEDEERPVVLFNTSSRLSGFSQNAAFTLLTGWGLQLAGVPVIHYTCKAGMTRCVLGANPDNPDKPPPCKACISQTKKLTAAGETRWFEYKDDIRLAEALAGLSLEELKKFEYTEQFASGSRVVTIPFGKLVLPSLRWVLRRHHLSDDAGTRYLFHEFIKSANRVAQTFSQLLMDTNPQAVVVFNGLQFPEAIARWIAQENGTRVISHEVGFQPFSTFFSDGAVTAYPIEIADDFELSSEQQNKIDSHLSRRFQGDFTMAGITFWPEMETLSDELLTFAKGFEQIVPIFTNVIFDTSQVHANTIFPHMFAWLDLLLGVIQKHTDTLFIIRAHPDEMREGKKSRESVQNWVEVHRVDQLKNVIFVPSDGAISSYDLIHRSKFVMVYNSSIGLEAALLGVPVLCGGKARYTQYPTVFLPNSQEEYARLANQFLESAKIDIPPEFEHNARKVLYHQFFRSSLLMGDYIEAHPTPGYVQLKNFSWRALLSENSPPLGVIVDGIRNNEPFLLPE